MVSKKAKTRIRADNRWITQELDGLKQAGLYNRIRTIGLDYFGILSGWGRMELENKSLQARIKMKSYRKELWFNIPARRGFVNTSPYQFPLWATYEYHYPMPPLNL